MILLDSVYINESGGKVLLEYFIKEIEKKGLLFNFFFLFDSRFNSSSLNLINEKQRFEVIASENNRRKFYKELSSDFNQFFCFGNVPPPIKINQKKVFILFHNALILNNKNMNYNFKTKFSLLLKKIYIINRNSENYKWIVQTANMKKQLTESLKLGKEAVEILPFYEENRFYNSNQKSPKNKGEFLYVANGVKQKNHQILLNAWEMIFDTKNLPITLHLTIPDSFSHLILEIERLQKKGVLIINHGNCDFIRLGELYKNCNYYISPSLTESFGLPLIEAAEVGCEIIAANLDYVYEVVKPLATFNPYQKNDIAQVIQSAFLGRYKNKTEIVIHNKINELIKLINNV